MATARNHHFQPQFYLQGFADERRRIRAYDVRRGFEIPSTHIRNVAGKRDLYRLDNVEIESDFAELVDGPASGASARIINSHAAGTDDRLMLGEYLAVLYYRTPAFAALYERVSARNFREAAISWARISLRARMPRQRHCLTSVGVPRLAARRSSSSRRGDYELRVTDKAGHLRIFGSRFIPDLTHAPIAQATALGARAG